MIPIKDLRIGDLVKTTTRNPILEKGSICKVVLIDALINSIIVQKSDVDVCRCLVKEEIEGIPLTPEILEKNGWNKRHDPTSSCDIYSKGKDAFYVSLEQSIYKKQEGFELVVADSTYRFGNKIQYVHQLQHILWVLGEDANLKI
nr:MAG TPA: hypothetical protein [Caudoviricetes sp.]